MAKPTLAEVNRQTSYNSPSEAASATLRSIAKDQDKEHAGMIVKGPDGKYYTTAPIESEFHDQFSVRLKPSDDGYKGWSLAGIYHTHPGDDQLGQYFSPGDVQTANGLKVPSYVRFLKDDSIRSYTPGVTKTQHIGDGTGYGDGAYGDPVAIPQPQPAMPTHVIPTNNTTPIVSNSTPIASR